MKREEDRGARRAEVTTPALARQCTPLGLALFLALAPGCASDPLEDGPDRERFVRAYVALGDAPGDPTARDSVLAEHGTTPEEMTAFVRRLAQDPQRLVRLWEEIRELEQDDPQGGAAGGRGPLGEDRPRPDTGDARSRAGPRSEGDDAGAKRTREVVREREEAQERARVRDLEREIERAREGRDSPSVEPPLDVAEPELPPEGVEEGLSGKADDL